MSGNAKAPMTPEQRAALEHRIATLRTLQAGGAAPQSAATAAAGLSPAAKAWQPNNPHDAPQPQPDQNRQQPTMQYGYDDGDDGNYEDYDGCDYDDYYDNEGYNELDAATEAFMNEMERLHAYQNLHDPQHQGDRYHADTVAALPSQMERVVGDFEVLRLAKMGDARSCFEFAAITGVDLRTFVDNLGRNALHYAADSGNIDLVKALLTEKHVPFIADTLGLTPLDVAILCSGDSTTANDTPPSSELTDTLIAEAVKVNSLSVDQKRLRSVEELCRIFGPKPPGFVMSKPAPTSPPATAERLFWTAAKKTEVSSGDDGTVRSATATQTELHGLPDAAALVNLVTTLYDTHATPEARDAWLAPLEEARVRSVWTDSTLLSTHKPADASVDGVVLSWHTGGHLQGFTSAALKNYSAKKLACVSALAVAPPLRGLGVATRLMHAAHDALKASGAEAAAFVTSTLLPSPPAMVSMVKWMRHVIEPTHIFADQAYAEAVLPEFFHEDQSLRAAAVLKGHISHALFEERRAAVLGWSPVDPSSDDQVDLLLQFLQTQTGPASGVELAYIPDDAAGLRHSLLGEGLAPYVNVNNAVVTDFVVFRRRELRANGQTSALNILDLVYATFTSVKAVEKAMHALFLVQHLHHADVLYVPTMFGFTDSDLVKAHFEEDLKQRQFLYIGNPQGATTASPVPKTPATKVALPLFLV